MSNLRKFAGNISFFSCHEYAIVLYKSNKVPIRLSYASGKHLIVIFLRSSGILNSFSLRIVDLSIADSNPSIEEKYHGEYVLMLESNIINFFNNSALSTSSFIIRYDHALVYIQ